MAALYVALIAATIAGVALLIEDGGREHAQPAIAGGYDLRQPNPCFGAVTAAIAGAPLPSTAPAQPPVAPASFDVQQSGEFVTLSNAAGSLGGQLRLYPAGRGHSPRLAGTVDCVGGGSQSFEGKVLTGPQ